MNVNELKRVNIPCSEPACAKYESGHDVLEELAKESDFEAIHNSPTLGGPTAQVWFSKAGEAPWRVELSVNEAAPNTDADEAEQFAALVSEAAARVRELNMSL